MKITKCEKSIEQIEETKSMRGGKIRVSSLPLLVFILYSLFVVFIEWINFCAFLFDGSIPLGIPELGSAFVLILLVFLFKKRFVIEKSEVDAGLVIGVVLFILMGFYFSVFPDNAFDTGNYHIISQNPAFRNYFADYFGYGNFQVWGFRLADRLFYYFRFVLGYRLGTILNPLVMALTYSEIYSFFRGIERKVQKSKVNVCIRIIWAVLAALPFESMLLIADYYVDYMFVPIAFECLWLIMKATDTLPNTFEIGWFAFLSGIIIAMKMTNVVFVIPMVVVYVVLCLKAFKLKEWIIAVLGGLFPFAPYPIFNYKCTGNPIFPYFNTIFQSKYFENINFKDVRFGGSNFIEKITWPFLCAIRPGDRHGEITGKYPIVLLLGWICVIIIFAIICKNYKSKGEYKKELSFLSILTSGFILWSFSTGYDRYVILGKILLGICVYYVLVWIIKFDKKWLYFIFYAITLCSILAFTYNGLTIVKGTNYSWTRYYVNDFFKQVTNILSDRNFDEEKVCLKYDAMIIPFTEYNSVSELINSEAYSIQAGYSEYVSDEVFKEGYDLLLQHACIGTYMPREAINADEYIDDYIDRFNSNNAFIQNPQTVSVGAKDYVIFDAEMYAGTNYLWISDELYLKMELIGVNGSQKISFISCSYYNWEDVGGDEIWCKIYIKNDSENRQIDTFHLNQRCVEQYSVEIDIEDNDEEVIVSFYNQDGVQLSKDTINKVYVINPQIEPVK